MKDVNDNPDTMKELMKGLLAIRVRPYYIYQADLTKGANHFRTPIEVGLNIMDKLRGHISGLAVPQFVIDAPGGGGKIPLLPNYVISRDEDKIILRNYKYNVYEYPDVRDESKITERDAYLRKQKKRKKVLDEKELISKLKIPVTNN
jgi:lysine 2,3-aminomutase